LFSAREKRDYWFQTSPMSAAIELTFCVPLKTSRRLR
jgi:hypothetical protein